MMWIVVIIAILCSWLSAVVGAFFGAAYFVAAYEKKITEFLERKEKEYLGDIKLRRIIDKLTRD